MSKIITAEEAAYLIKDNSVIGIGSMGLAGWPEEVAKEIEKRYLNTGFPRDLTIKQGSATGDWKERGVTRFGHEGLVKKWCAAHIGSAAKMNKLVIENKIEAHCIPQGVAVNLWREIAANRPGLLTKVGLGTFVDPRIEGGRMNQLTKENVADLVELNGEEWLFYKSFKLDYALIRGTTIDEAGNLTMENEGFISEALALAEAAHNSGGIVIAQAEYMALKGSLDPKMVRVPGVLVDYIVIAQEKESCWQTEGQYFEPSFAGRLRKPLAEIPKLPLSERKVIARRAAMELKIGNVVNLGYGMPADVASVASEEGVSDLITLTTEAGSIGGVPASVPDFGNSYNPLAMIDHGAMFDYYDGGGLDIAFLGLAQTDKSGDINVSKFGNRLTGPGGFINITQSSKKVVFCGTFTAGSKIEIADGKILIKEEGSKKKFIDKVEQITFSGEYADKNGQPVLYITERAVFELKEGKITLIEIAPGIDLNKDLLELMEFKPEISKNLKVMDESLFKTEWGKLKNIIK